MNIWDDYYEDGSVPEDDVQETYAYVESDIVDTDSKVILEALKTKIDQFAEKQSIPTLTTEIEFYDSAKVYPNLLGTRYERMLYKRWQLKIINLSHDVRQRLVGSLKEWDYKHSSCPVEVYSES
ncbi:hypothetical protein [Marinimicrobium sp. ABcell2]|uniref:hypothetical protein n=1 Tax=Marinimicrobium sp. ABcell2 TaxID=3069751 RepID=UPI0027B63FD7|nr:hypothetical protein [Marinimicrobium sp. ABcell2]MDQ2078537.1 hypothetical protein [Marinimicrobium sp. ABcell2]